MRLFLVLFIFGGCKVTVDPCQRFGGTTVTTPAEITLCPMRPIDSLGCAQVGWPTCAEPPAE
ncbi:hypothetical protein EBS80_02995 [bacterium]|nr:hypothetical protein [bacterium]